METEAKATLAPMPEVRRMAAVAAAAVVVVPAAT